MKYIICSALVLTGCMSNQPQPFRETPECMNYRGMMTAPMPPDAMERLKQKCVESRNNQA
ncbi:hypothetical protein [Acinetobacter sp. WCHAc010052]|uniref:hypothetical protein n=1 Tax=Acinetobacter sp. WCHAc010052 TaxID=2004647 RepID=UPI000B3BEF48|nr:hypothetical protein [Acinetobacter sp. WCHAc010052]AXY60206.1 hypothetical protein CDG61_09305 [Acinetobacter sp. WCHAc010052]